MITVHAARAALVNAGLLGIALCAATGASVAAPDTGAAPSVTRHGSAHPADEDLHSTRRAAAADVARRGAGPPKAVKPQPATTRGMPSNAARVRSVLGAQGRGRAAQTARRGATRKAGAGPESAAAAVRPAAPRRAAMPPAPRTPTATYIRAVTQSRMLGGTPAPAARLGSTPAAKVSRKATIDGGALRRRY